MRKIYTGNKIIKGSERVTNPSSISRGRREATGEEQGGSHISAMLCVVKWVPIMKMKLQGREVFSRASPPAQVLHTYHYLRGPLLPFQDRGHPTLASE